MITKEQADKIVEAHESFYKKEIQINGKSIILFNYILSDYETFQKEPLSRELRGLVFVENKMFPSVPKFFNINEIQETMYSSIKHKKIKHVFDKLDGSMITPIEINGDIIMKSKASFDSDQSKLAQELVDTNEELKFFILDCWANDFYPFFELIGPDNEHVIEYPLKENKLVLIMVRDQDGHFIDINKFNYEKAKGFNLTIEELLEKQKTEKGIEGWVVYYKDQLLKVKTEEFFVLHKIKEQSDSFKSVLNLILNEDLDDVLSIVSELKREKLLGYNKTVTDYVVHKIHEIETINKLTKNKTPKDVALEYKGHEFFNVIMASKKGKPVKETLIDSSRC